MLKKVITVENLDQLAEFSRNLAAKIKGGETIELKGDLGSGKTALVKCLAGQLDSKDHVSSPSFTIENIYRCPRFDIHHFDFYRLDEAGVAGHELQEVLNQPDKLVIIEWPGLVDDILDMRRLTIAISLTGNQSETRQLTLTAPAELEYLL